MHIREASPDAQMRDIWLVTVEDLKWSAISKHGGGAAINNMHQVERASPQNEDGSDSL